MRVAPALSVCAFCLVIALYAGTATAEPEAPKSVRSILICYPSQTTDYPSRSAGAAVARMLRYRASNMPQLSNLPPMNVVERVLTQEGLSPRLSLALPDALKIARISGQEWAVVGSVRRQDETFTFTLEVYGAASGNMIGKPITVSGTAEELPRVECDLAKRLLGGIGLQLTPEQKADLGKPLTAEFKAIRLLGDYLLANEKASSALLDKALIADTKFPVTAVHRADRALEEGRYADTLTIVKPWVKRLPTNRDFASYEFGAAFAAGRYEEAEKVLKKLNKSYPDSFAVALLQYWLCRTRGERIDALQTARRLTTLNPSSAEGHARVCAAALDRAIDIAGNDLLSQMKVKQATQYAAMIDTACDSGETATQFDPKYQQALVTLLSAYRERGDYAKCEHVFHQVMSLNASNRDAKVGMALVYLCQGRSHPARALLEGAGKGSEGAEVLLGLALCSNMDSDHTSAMTYWGRALDLDKSILDPRYLRHRKLWPTELALSAAGLAAAR